MSSSINRLYKSLASWAPPVLVFFFFLLTRLSFYKNYADWDEINFISQVSWLDQGHRLYQDIITGYPPFWYWTVVALWRLLQLSDPWSKYYLAKVLSVISVAALGVILYLLANRLYNSKIFGLAASALFFSSSNSFYYGVTAAPQYYTTMLMVFAIFAFLYEGHRYVFLSALTLGFSLMSRYSVMPVAFVLIGFALLRAIFRKNWKLFPIAGIGLIIPAVILILPYWVPYSGLLFRYYVVDIITPTRSMSLSEKFGVFQSSVYSPIYLFAFSGLLPFLLIDRNWRKCFVLICLLCLTALFFASPIAEGHRLIESEPLAAVIGAAILMPLTKLFRANRESRKIQGIVHHTIPLVGLSIILSLMLFSANSLAVPKIDASLRKVTDEPRNIGLQMIVKCVREHTEQGDYVICGHPLIAFLADRGTPPGGHPILGDENLIEVSLRYDVKLVVIGAGYSPPYFEDYVRKNYAFVQEFPYWGSVYMRK